MALDIWLASESPGPRTGSISSVFPFLCCKFWFLLLLLTLCHIRWLPEWRQPQGLEGYRAAPVEDLAMAKKRELFLLPSV